MPTGTAENTEFTFTGHFLGDDQEEKAKKEIHIHIEHLGNLDLQIQM